MSTVRIGRDDFKPPQHPYDDHRAPGGLHSSHKRRQRIAVPAIPDLRFEHTYLRNVRKHVHVERVKAHIHEKAEVQAYPPGAEVVHVAWGNVLWITFKEQVISPLIQGLLWGALRWYLIPSAAIFGQNFRAWWERGDALASRRRGDRQTIDGVRSLVFPKPA